MNYTAYNNTPLLHSTACVADGARLIGKVTLEEGANVWYNAVLRGDIAEIQVGKNSNIQDNCTLHVGKTCPCIVGSDVTVGHGAILHGCTVHDNTLIGMGAIVLNGAVVGKNCIVGAGALVTQNTVIPDNSLVLGSPAKVKRAVTPKEILHNAQSAAEYAAWAKEQFGSKEQ